MPLAEPQTAFQDDVLTAVVILIVIIAATGLIYMLANPPKQDKKED